MKTKKKFKILIVDDIPKNIQLAANILKTEGYQMAFAQNGKSALSHARLNRFDLILLDVMMPDMDGFAVCEELRKNSVNKDVPVIFLTAKNLSESIVKGFEVGAMDYVTKPFQGAELLARVKTHLELFRSREELKKVNQQLKNEITERMQVEEELRKSEEKYRYLAVHDNLTGLNNTRYLYQSLEELITASAAENNPFSLIFLDIDNFKEVVDAYGHLNGSQALAEVSATIRESIVEPAYGVAYGGDEFVVVLPGFDKTQAMQKAEEIRSRMKETIYLANRGHKVSLHASYGVSAYPDDATDMTGLLAQADRAMFDIKAKGKDAVGGSIGADPKHQEHF
jgi:diguanylate cyclase (GGDEF)-like protein